MLNIAKVTRILQIHGIHFVLNLVFSLSLIFLSSILLIGNEDVNLSPYNYILLLLSNALLLFRVRRNMVMVLVLIVVAYCNYSIIYLQFINNPGDYLTSEINQNVTNESINILTLFNLFLYCIFPITIRPLHHISKETFRCSRSLPNWALLLAIIVLCIIWITGLKPGEIGQRQDPSAIYEYTVCLFIVLFCFVKSPKALWILGILSIMFALKNFIFGGRIAGIQFIICTYLFLFVHRIKMKTVVMLGAILFVFMSIIGTVRGTLLQGEFSINQILDNIVKSGFSLDTASSAYFTSEVFVYMSDFVSDYLILLGVFICAIFMGYGMFPGMLLQDYANKYIVNYAGGVYPFYFWFFLGYLGIIVSVLILKAYFNLANKIVYTSSGLVKCILAFFICHVFRWYLYTPYSLFRGTLFISIIYGLAFLISKSDNKEVVA